MSVSKVTPGVDPQRAAVIARMEELGPAQMRLLIQNGGWPQVYHAATIEWLAQKDQEAERLKEFSQAEQVEIASLAKDAAIRAAAAAERQATAAEKANTRATIALVIAVISAIASGASIWVSHRDTTHQEGAP